MAKNKKINNDKLDAKDILVRQRVNKVFTKTITIVFLIIMALVIIIPFYWMLNTSFKTSKEADNPVPTLYPKTFTLENYKIALLGQRLYKLNAAKDFLAKYPTRKKELEDYLKQHQAEYNANSAQYDLDVKDDNKVYTPEYQKIRPILKLYDGIKDRKRNLLTQNSTLLVSIGNIETQLQSLNSDINAVRAAYNAETNPDNKKYFKQKLQGFEGQYNLKNLLLTTYQTSLNSNNKEIEDIDKKLGDTKNLNKYYDAKKLETTLQNENKIYNSSFLKLRNIVVPYRDTKQKLTLLEDNFNKETKNEKTYSIVTPGSSNENFGIFLLNTLIVGIASTILGTLISIIGAFALSRLSFKGRDTIFSIMLATMMIPGEMMVISNYITVTKLGWNDTKPAFQGAAYFAMIVPFLVTVFHIYLLRQNFKQIPNELYYAAKVDGTSDWKYLWKIMVPLAKSSIITIVILKLMGSWNAYIWPNLVAGKHKLITVWLRTAFTDETGRTAVEQQMAATVIVLIPLLLVFIFLRKYIMKGVSRGGTKG